MNRFLFFENGCGLAGVKLGLIPISKLVQYDMYKDYLALLDKGISQAEARNKITFDSGYSESTISRAISFFEEREANRDRLQILANGNGK